MRVLAIDPGTEQSGWCIFDGAEVVMSGVNQNEDVLNMVVEHRDGGLAIEMVASYGMAVGREVFETVRWIGRFQQAWHRPDDVALIFRRDVKLFLCGTTAAKDANVRQAIIDRFPATGGGAKPQIGTKQQPGPLYGVSSHAWPAIGVAMLWCERNKDGCAANSGDIRRSGCWSAEPRRKVTVEHAMSVDCRQVDHDILPECAGCQVIKDLDYINAQRAAMRKV